MASSTQGLFVPTYPKLCRFVSGPVGSGCVVGEQPSCCNPKVQPPMTTFQADMTSFSAAETATLLRFTTDFPSRSRIRSDEYSIGETRVGGKEFLDASSRFGGRRVSRLAQTS